MASHEERTDPPHSGHRRIQAARLVAVPTQPKPCLADPRALSHAHWPILSLMSNRATPGPHTETREESAAAEESISSPPATPSRQSSPPLGDVAPLMHSSIGPLSLWGALHRP